RHEEPETGGEDRPEHERQPLVLHPAAALVDGRQRGADHPHHERPADQPGAQHECQVHVGVLRAVRRPLARPLHHDDAERALSRLRPDECVVAPHFGGERRPGERDAPRPLGADRARREPPALGCVCTAIWRMPSSDTATAASATTRVARTTKRSFTSPLTSRKTRRNPDALKYATSRSRGTRSPPKTPASTENSRKPTIGRLVGVR